MEDFLQRMRGRPLHHRKAISMAGAGAVTSVLGLLWAVTLAHGGGPIIHSNTASDAAAAAAAANLEVKETQLDALRAQYGAPNTSQQNPAPYQFGGVANEPEAQYQDPNRTVHVPPAYDANASLWYSPGTEPGGR